MNSLSGQIPGAALKSESRAVLERTPTVAGPLPTAVGDRMQASEMGIGCVHQRHPSTLTLLGLRRVQEHGQNFISFT
jgi:hypothetical protein